MSASSRKTLYDKADMSLWVRIEAESAGQELVLREYQQSRTPGEDGQENVVEYRLLPGQKRRLSALLARETGEKGGLLELLPDVFPGAFGGRLFYEFCTKNGLAVRRAVKDSAWTLSA